MPAASPTPQAPPTLQLFGPPALVRGDTLHHLPASAPTWLLACLGTAGDWQGRDQLSLRFWPDASAADAQRQLRVTLHRSRQLLQALGADEALQAERTRLRLTLPCDVPQFRAALARGDRAAALRLQPQPLLAGHGLRGYAELDAWLAQQREQLHADWRAAALREAAALGAAGLAGPAVALLLQQLKHDLLAEDVVQALLRLAPAAGERLAALAQFDNFRRRAAEELGLAPLPETLALAEALRRDVGGGVPTPTASAAHADAAPVELPDALRRVPLLGRAEDLAWLQRPGGGLRVVSGEPGLGKSRLVADALPHALWVQGRDSQRSAPLRALAQALEPQLPTLQALGLTAGERLELARLLPALAEGQTLPPADPAAPGLPGALAAVLARWPHPLVLDDLQWLDETTLQVVAQALALGARGWVATQRPAELPPATLKWLQARKAEGQAELRSLAALSPAAVAELAAQLAGRPVPGFARWLGQRCGGNPFFALECVAALFDDGRLDARRADWAQGLVNWPDESAPAVPPRVAHVLRRRLGHLGEATQRVLGIAAVAGDAQALETLAELAGLSAFATAQALAQAQAAGLLQGRRFAHDLVRQVLLDDTPEPLRVVLHGGIARRLAGVLPPHTVADHWWAAGDAAQAMQATLRAATHDGDLGLSDAAVQLLQGLLARLQALPALPPGVEVASLHRALSRVECQRERMDESERHAQAALAALPLPATRQGALLELFEVAAYRGQPEAARAWLDAAREIDPELPKLAMAEAKLAYLCGDAASLVRHAARYLQWLRRQPPGIELATVLTSQAVGHDMQGQTEQALALHHEALAVARQLRARHTEVEVLSNIVVCLGEAGRDAEAVALALPVLQGNDDETYTMMRANTAYSLVALGRLDEAEGLYRQVQQSSNVNAACQAAGKLFEIAARRGASQAARDTAAEAVFAALARTDLYQAQASALIALLQHGSDAQAQRVLPCLRANGLLRGQQERLDAALAKRGLVGGAPAEAQPG